MNEKENNLNLDSERMKFEIDFIKNKIKKELKLIKYDDEITRSCSKEEWDFLIKEINKDSNIKEVHKSIFYYFLEVLPPIKMFKNGFLFREGLGECLKFTNENGRYFCQRIN